MTNNEETVGQMIARAREEKHLSKRELSRIAKISDTELARIESGEREIPNPKTLRKISKVIGLLTRKEFDFDTKITSNLTLTAKYNKKISWTEIAIVLVGAVLLYKVNPKKFKKEVKKIMK